MLIQPDSALPTTFSLQKPSPMANSISLILAHPRELIRAGLRTLLAPAGVTIVGEATTPQQALLLAKKHKPQVLLLDTSMPGGDNFSLVADLRESLPKMGVVMISVSDSPTYVARAITAGACDYLLESVTARELVSTLEHAAAGTKPAASSLFGRISDNMSERKYNPALEGQLTPREQQVLRHIAMGLSNAEIGKSLSISVETVKEHVQNLLRKLEVGDRTHAAVWALKHGVA